MCVSSEECSPARKQEKMHLLFPLVLFLTNFFSFFFFSLRTLILPAHIFLFGVEGHLRCPFLPHILPTYLTFSTPFIKHPTPPPSLMERPPILTNTCYQLRATGELENISQPTKVEALGFCVMAHSCRHSPVTLGLCITHSEPQFALLGNFCLLGPLYRPGWPGLAAGLQGALDVTRGSSLTWTLGS